MWKLEIDEVENVSAKRRRERRATNDIDLPEIQSWDGPKQDVGDVELSDRRSIGFRVSEKIRLSLGGLEDCGKGGERMSSTSSRRRIARDSQPATTR